MGITSFSVELIQKYKGEAKDVCELGAQNLYNQPELPAPYAKKWYEIMGIFYTSIDLSKENESLPLDLSLPLNQQEEQKQLQNFDLVTDFGTSEHVGKNGKHHIEAIYNCWKTKHDILTAGGIMINENPKTGNWPGHGFNYYTKEFYELLAAANGYTILELGEHPAMGNTTDGWNIYCVLRKTADIPFIAIEAFKNFGIKTK